MLTENLKNEFKKLICNYIGTDALRGVYWYIFKDSEESEKEIENLKELLVKNGEDISDYIDIVQIDKGNIIVFNRDKFQEYTTEILTDFYRFNPKFPETTVRFDINSSRENEIKLFAEYLKIINEKEIDVFLYREDTFLNDRKDTLILSDGENLYKKRIYGFSLIKEDIKDVNNVLYESGLKIDSIQEGECINQELGVRYTLILSKIEK